MLSSLSASAYANAPLQISTTVVAGEESNWLLFVRSATQESRRLLRLTASLPRLLLLLGGLTSMDIDPGPEQSEAGAAAASFHRVLLILHLPFEKERLASTTRRGHSKPSFFSLLLLLQPTPCYLTPPFRRLLWSPRHWHSLLPLSPCEHDTSESFLTTIPQTSSLSIGFKLSPLPLYWSSLIPRSSLPSSSSCLGPSSIPS